MYIYFSLFAFLGLFLLKPLVECGPSTLAPTNVNKTLNLENLLDEKLSIELREEIFVDYYKLGLNPMELSPLNLTVRTLKNLNMHYENYISEMAAELVLVPNIPIEKGEIYLKMVPVREVRITISKLMSHLKPWNSLPGKFVIMSNLIRFFYRSVAQWDSQLITYYSIFMDGLSESQLDLFEYELPLRRLNEATKDLSVLQTKYGYVSACYALNRNLNENARRLSDVALSDFSSKLLLSCASLSDLLLQHTSLYNLIQSDVNLQPRSSTRSVLNQLVPYMVSTSKPIPSSLINGLDVLVLQSIASKYQFSSSFLQKVVGHLDYSVIELSEHYVTQYDSLDLSKRMTMAPYLHISQLEEFQHNIRLLCSQIGQILPYLLSTGQKLTLFSYYKNFCHASNGVVNYGALSRNKLSFCMFSSDEIDNLSMDDLKEMHDLILTDCACLNGLQKFTIFNKVKNDMLESEFFRDFLTCFDEVLTLDFIELLIQRIFPQKNYCNYKAPSELLSSEKISYTYLHHFNFSFCSDVEKLALLQTLKFTDFGIMKPKDSSFLLDYANQASGQFQLREERQETVNQLLAVSSPEISELQSYALPGLTTAEMPIDFVSKSRFCSEAITSIGLVLHEDLPVSILKSWVDVYFMCQPNKLVLATRKDIDLLGNLTCYISPSWVKTMTAYTFKVYLSRISDCFIDFKLGKVIGEMVLKHNFVDEFTLSSIAPLYCFIDPKLNNTEVLLPKSFYSTAVNKIYRSSYSKFFEMSPTDLKTLFTCANNLSVMASNKKPSSFSLATLSCSNRLATDQLSCWHYLKFQHSRIPVLKNMSVCEIEKCLRHMEVFAWDSAAMLPILQKYLSTSSESGGVSKELSALMDTGKAIEVLNEQDLDKLLEFKSNSDKYLTNIEFVNFLLDLDLSYGVLTALANKLYNEIFKTQRAYSAEGDTRVQFLLNKFERKLQKVSAFPGIMSCDVIRKYDYITLNQILEIKTIEFKTHHMMCLSTETWRKLSNTWPVVAEKLLRKIYGNHRIPESQFQKLGLFHLMTNTSKNSESVNGNVADYSNHAENENGKTGHEISGDGYLFHNAESYNQGKTYLIYVYALSQSLNSNCYLMIVLCISSVLQVLHYF